MIALNIITSTVVYNIALKGYENVNLPLKIQHFLVKLEKYLLIPANYYANDAGSHLFRNEDKIPTEEERRNDMEKFKKLKKKANWLLLAAVVDRIFFILYLLVNIIAPICIFFIK